MTDTDWITDRPPTEADADEHGLVLARWPYKSNPALLWSSPAEWEAVTTGTPWRHTSMWGSAPTTIPRKFTSITHADDRYLALADDGTAWEDYGNGWVQLDPLPAREVAA